jgi:hypothetical protein
MVNVFDEAYALSNIISTYLGNSKAAIEVSAMKNLFEFLLLSPRRSESNDSAIIAAFKPMPAKAIVTNSD